VLLQTCTTDRGVVGTGAVTEASSFVSASVISAAAPAEKLPFRMSRPLLDTTSPDAQSLGKLLGIKSLNMAQLLIQVNVVHVFYKCFSTVFQLLAFFLFNS